MKIKKILYYMIAVRELESMAEFAAVVSMYYVYV